MDPTPDRAAADAAALLAELRAGGLTLATAESLTGGGLGARLTGVPGASTVYVGGVVSYATRVKQELLGVPATVVAAHGVVSAECAEAMATGVRDLLGADVALSTTGVAGPDAQEGKPVGTVFVGVAGPLGSRHVALRLGGDREAVRAATVAEALRAARATVSAVVPREVSRGG